MKKTEEQREAEFRAQFEEKASVITRTMVYQTAVAAGIRRLDDPRIAILNEAADAFEKYDHQLRWLAEKLNDEIRKLNAHGTQAVHVTVLSTSLIDDVKHAASALETAKNLIGRSGLFHGSKDEAHDAIDDLASSITR
jgi:hypothetical protein